ncbi:alpha/beta hydrolase [Pseudomonas moorei]|uniref:alpha/beta hydrolase n=1 Tax=Pseudomonas moorei TaxID=395599 RepID=UPI001FF63B04|nr:alpha/beta hydrolase [Pseudomonas moorei]
MQNVQFKNRDVVLAGHLYLPIGFDENQLYPAIITVHPGGGVKEQTAGTYAKLLADQGFITLAFDASYQGESGGEPHFLDEPMNRVADVYSAVDYLTTLHFVDAGRIGVLGICAGGGFAVKAASIDHRIKAVATASAVNVGSATRKGWEGKGSINDLLPILDALANQRTAEAKGAEVVYAPYVPPLGDTSAPRDLQVAADYYLTARAQHPNAQNRMLMNGLGAWVAFDAFDLVEQLLTQPILVIAGGKAGSLWHIQELYAKAQGQKELLIIGGAAHMDLYDGEHVGAALTQLASFFQGYL